MSKEPSNNVTPLRTLAQRKRAHKPKRPQKPGELELSMDELELAAHLSDTGLSVLRMQLLSGEVPPEHVAKLKAIVTRGEIMVAKLERTIKGGKGGES